MFSLALLLLLAIDCNCDPQKPDTMKQRHCSLCGEAEKQDAAQRVFILKDISPRKPNRWLALPREHGHGQHHLHEMPAGERAELWTAAIAKAKELFGEEDWGVAYNGAEVRTQCHTHLHIGRFARAAESESGFVVASKPAEIPAPEGKGVWIHAIPGGKFHIHAGEQITETVLVR